VPIKTMRKEITERTTAIKSSLVQESASSLLQSFFY